MSKIYLKVKLKSLAEEAKIIRKEEQKAIRQGRWLLKKQSDATAPYSLYKSLKDHRAHPVGTEARASLIAYGFINDLPYKRVEQPKETKALTFNKWQKQLPATELARYVAMNKEVPQEYVDNITNRAYTLINKYGRKITFEEFEKWVTT